MFAICFCCNRLPSLLPEQACLFTIITTYTTPKHPSYLPLPLMCNTVWNIELRGSNLPCTPLPPVISRLYLALVSPKDCIPLFESPMLMFNSPIEPLLLIRCRERWLLPSYSSCILFLLKCCSNSFRTTIPF